MSTTISQNAGVNTARTVTVYKDSLATSALATTNFTAIQVGSSMSRTQFAVEQPSDNFTDVEIASGASKTFFFTFDTTDAAAAENLSIRVGNTYVRWTDGVTATITAMANELPLQFKTFTY